MAKGAVFIFILIFQLHLFGAASKIRKVARRDGRGYGHLLLDPVGQEWLESVKSEKSVRVNFLNGMIHCKVVEFPSYEEAREHLLMVFKRDDIRRNGCTLSIVDSLEFCGTKSRRFEDFFKHVSTKHRVFE